MEMRLMSFLDSSVLGAIWSVKLHKAIRKDWESMDLLVAVSPRCCTITSLVL